MTLPPWCASTRGTVSLCAPRRGGFCASVTHGTGSVAWACCSRLPKTNQTRNDVDSRGEPSAQGQSLWVVQSRCDYRTQSTCKTRPSCQGRGFCVSQKLRNWKLGSDHGYLGKPWKNRGLTPIFRHRAQRPAPRREAVRRAAAGRTRPGPAAQRRAHHPTATAAPSARLHVASRTIA